MAAKSKVNFAEVAKTDCPACGKSNAAYRRLCSFCGAALSTVDASSSQAILPPANASKAMQETSAPAAEQTEFAAAFAQGLPDWDLEPPQVVLRRKRK